MGICNRSVWPVVLTLLALLLTGCPPQRPDVVRQPPLTIPPYRELALRYNVNTAGLEKLWSRATVDFNWRDEKGKHHQQGEGNLIMVLPDKLALSVGKLGNTVFWVGYDAQRYWLFDLQDDGVVMVGRHENLSKLTTRSLPVPVHPLLWPTLMGFVHLDPEAVPSEPAVEVIDGLYVIEPPNTSLRLALDPVTALPRRIDLLNARGQSVVIARLSEHQRMNIAGLAPAAQPWVPTRIELQNVGQDGTVKLRLSDLTDDTDRIRDKAFDLEKLIKAHKPKERIDLDAE